MTFPHVLRLVREYFYIFGSIVSLFAVYMVDNFTWSQWPPQHFLGDDPVLVPAVVFPVGFALALVQ